MELDPVLVDTGALVALVDKDDEWHAWATRIYATLLPPLLTCEAVLTEAWHLLRATPSRRLAIPKLHARGIIRVQFDVEQESAAVYQLLAKYADLPMDFADACVVRMAELHLRARVWTIDTEFEIYRRHGRQPIPLIIPDRPN